MTVLGVLAAGAIGAVGRHLLVMVLESHPRRRFPVGVIAANVIGSLVLGVLVGARLDGGIAASTLTLAGTGFCGALTTWSTFVADATERIEAGDRRSASLVIAVSLVLGGGAAAAGLALTGGL